MNKRLTIALLLGAILVPSLVMAAPRFGVGARLDGISGGIEFSLYIPLGENASFFIAPHGIGVLASSGDYQQYFYSAGLRLGAAFSPQRVFSPLVGVGAAVTSNSDGSYRLFQYGGRVYGGISLAPFVTLSEEAGWASGLQGLRFTFDSGLRYVMMTETYRHDTYEETSTPSWVFPDIGAGISFTW